MPSRRKNSRRSSTTSPEASPRYPSERCERKACVKSSFPLSNELLVEVVHAIVTRASSKKIDRVMLLLSIVDIFSGVKDFSSRRLLKMHVISQNRGYDVASNIFISPEPKRKRFGQYDFVEGEVLEYLTLGEKRSLARTKERDVLNRLLYDPHPLVVRNVLENPRLTEHDVIKIVSKRPNHEQALRTIYLNDKWLSSYQVKLALSKNPYTPVNIALGLLFFLKIQDLAEIARDRTIHEVIKKTARGLLP